MITTITLNASIDKAYYMEKAIVDGTVMRVKNVVNTAGGKGLNVAKVINLSGRKVQATGFVGGFNGEYLKNMLDEQGVAHNFVEVEGETRSCINILDPVNGSTEFLEPGFTLHDSDRDAFLERLPEITKDSDVVAISGSAPKGIDKDIYFHIVSTLKAAGKTVLLDTSGELLKNGIVAGPDLVKPNQEELEALFDIKIESTEQVIACAKKLQENGIANVVISLGAEGALYLSKEGVFTGKPPKLEVLNTVGCGDSMIGAFAVALEEHMKADDALRFAIAVSSANTLTPGTGDYRKEDFEAIYPRVEIKHI